MMGAYFFLATNLLATKFLENVVSCSLSSAYESNYSEFIDYFSCYFYTLNTYKINTKLNDILSSRKKTTKWKVASQHIKFRLLLDKKE